MVALIDLQYLPTLEYFSVLLSSERVVIEKHEHYVKQSFRNRCIINTSNGILKLVIPVTAKHNKASISEVKIDHRSKWQSLHWRAIRSAYGKAPFFDHYGPALEKIIFKRHDFLFDLNFELLSFCLQSARLDVKLSETSAYVKVSEKGITDLRSAINPKISYTMRSFFSPVPYVQVFGNKFVTNLSFIDLLFCEGPNARQILLSSTRGI